MVLQKINIKGRSIQQDEEVDFAKIGNVVAFTIRNTGNVPMLIENFEIVPPGEEFESNISNMIINNRYFSVKFLADGIANPNRRASLWYGVISV